MEDPATTDMKKRADLFESQYNKLKKEFKDYIETSRKNEDTKKRELQADAAKKMLVFADSLSRMSGAAAGAPTCELVNSTNENFQKNIDVMYKQLLSVSGLTPVDPAPGDRFDDTLHMAIGLEYGSRYPDETVYRVIRKGYLREKTLIRPAEVILSKRPREEIKAQERGIWTSIARRLFPARPQISLLDQQVDALEHARSETTVRLEGEIATVTQSVSQLVADKQETDKRMQELEDAIGNFEEEIGTIREEIPKSFAKKRDVDQFIREQADAIARLTAELEYSRDYLSQSVATKQDVDELIREQAEMIEHLNAEVENVKEFLAQSVPEHSRLGLTEAEEQCAAPEPAPAGMSGEPVTAPPGEDELHSLLEPEEELLEPVADEHAVLPFSGIPVPENPDNLPISKSHEIPGQMDTEPTVGDNSVSFLKPKDNLPEPVSREIPEQMITEPTVGDNTVTLPEPASREIPEQMVSELPTGDNTVFLPEPPSREIPEQMVTEPTVGDNPVSLPEPASHEIPGQMDTEPTVGDNTVSLPEPASREIPEQMVAELPAGDNTVSLPEPPSREIPEQMDTEPPVGDPPAIPPETGGEHPPREKPVPDADSCASKVLNTEPGNI